MQPDPEDQPLSLNDPDAVRRARDVLECAGYTESRILDVLGTKELPPVRTRASLLPLWRRQTAGGSPLEELLRLFLLHEPVRPEAFERAVQPMEPREWAELGLVRIGTHSVMAAFQLLPYREFVLAADWPGQPAGMHKHVMAVTGSSRTLADFTVRRPARRTLDLGTGCGVQALLAAAHSDQVWAVDRNPRAVNVAAFNARLNGLPGIECQAGDLFEPVRGQQFDLIVSNLPFVISPESRYLYCQSGMQGDQLCRTVARAAPRFLREGGCCQLISDLAHVAGEDFEQRLAGWFEGTGCDAWVLHALTVDAATYAAHWLRETEGPDLSRCGERFDEWMACYERGGIEAVSFGLIALRRRSGKNWFRCQEVPGPRTPSGDDVVLGFALRDYLDTVRDDAALLEARLRCAPDVRLEQELEPSAGGWKMVASRLYDSGDWAGKLPADSTALFLVSHCRGEARLRDVLAGLASATGRDPAAVLPECLALVRRLVERGVLLPASPGQGTPPGGGSAAHWTGQDFSGNSQ